MGLKNKLLFLSFLHLTFFSSSSLEAKIILPELLAKQATNNIRFISHDAKFTYYQKRSGSLHFSTNYQVKEFISGKIGSQFSMLSSPARKKIIITQNESFNSYFSIRNNLKLFIVDYGKFQPKPLGEGISPKLHLNDEWASYFDSAEKSIIFQNIDNNILKFKIVLNNNINPYFVPEVVMANEDTIFYTDLSGNGEVGILKHSRSTGKTDLLLKTRSHNLRAELCLNAKDIYFAQYGINQSKLGTNISRIKFPFTDFSKRELIYQSSDDDIGQLICNYSNESLYLLKKYPTVSGFDVDVAEINTTTKEVKLASELKTVTSLINMDGTLLALNKGKYFIVKGNFDFKNVDSLGALPPESASESIREMDKNKK